MLSIYLSGSKMGRGRKYPRNIRNYNNMFNTADHLMNKLNQEVRIVY